MEQKQVSEYTDSELSEIKVGALKTIIQAQSTLSQAQSTVQVIETEEKKRKDAEVKKK